MFDKNKMTMVVALLPLLMQGHASAFTCADFFVADPGLACKHWVEDVDLIQYNANGAGNGDATNGLTTVCPVRFFAYPDGSPPTEGWINPSEMRVDYYDQHDGASISAQIGMKNESGTLWLSEAMYSCGTAGGCASDNDLDFTGRGSLDFDTQENFYQQGIVSMFFLTNLPDSDLGVSYITGYRVCFIGPA